MIYAVVLAAGASSRYGVSPPKQVELLPRVLDAVHAHLELEARAGGYVAQDRAAPALNAGRAALAGLLGVPEAGLALTESATASLRAAQSDRGPAGASAGAVFDFGTARREHEQRWPSELQDAFIAMLMSLPAPYRAYVRRTLYGRVEALAAERPVTAEDLHRLLNELRASIALK